MNNLYQLKATVFSSKKNRLITIALLISMILTLWLKIAFPIMSTRSETLAEKIELTNSESTKLQTKITESVKQIENGDLEKSNKSLRNLNNNIKKQKAKIDSLLQQAKSPIEPAALIERMLNLTPNLSLVKIDTGRSTSKRVSKNDDSQLTKKSYSVHSQTISAVTKGTYGSFFKFALMIDASPMDLIEYHLSADGRGQVVVTAKIKYTLLKQEESE